MTEEDLVEITTTKAAAPRSIESAGMPGLLNMMSTEWDTLMLEVYTLRKNLDDTRKELSHALYQHDAACQVILRMLEEKEALENRLEASNQAMTDLQEELI